MMMYEAKVFLTAVRFFTRIPVPSSLEYNQEMLNRSLKYLPLIGWLIGGIGAGVFYGTTYLFPLPVRILLSMTATLLMTGAFHEDGFADVCDGFGGGWNKEEILKIMKDSRIGSFGTIGILMMLLSKFVLLTSILPAHIPFVMIAAHSVSRFAAVSLVYTHRYVDHQDSKSKPVGTRISFPELMISAVFGVIPMVWMHSLYFLMLLVPVFLAKGLLARYFNRWIGGYTGDCLGATQQVTEVIFYLAYTGMVKSGF